MDENIARETVGAPPPRVPATAARPLLLFNRIGANLELVFPFIDALAGHEIVLSDMPGIGGSPLWRVPRRFGGLARRYSPGPVLTCPTRALMVHCRI